MSKARDHQEVVAAQEAQIGDRTARGLLVEGLVIVASILLAFAIDAGWDELREREQEQRLLAQLTDELNLFIDNLGPSAKGVSDRVGGDIDRLLEFIHGSSDSMTDSTSEPTLEEWMDALSWLHRAYEFSAATPVIDLLTADGGLQKISDPAIREELSNVSSFLGVVERFEEIQGDFIAGEMIPWLNRNVDRYAVFQRSGMGTNDTSPSRFELDLDALNTREFSNLLVERQRLLSVVARFRAQALERMTELREILDAQRED